MTRHETEPTPAKVWFTCDGCERELEPDRVDAKIEIMDRDFSGAVVYSHMLHLCMSCRRRVQETMRNIPEADQ